MNNNNNDDSTSPQQYHAISCKSCRHLHLFCDKLLPACSECSQRGKACCYEKPKKRGRPVSKKSLESSPSDSNSHDCSTSNSSSSSKSNSSGGSSSNSGKSSKSGGGDTNKIVRKGFTFELSEYDDENKERIVQKSNIDSRRYHPYYYSKNELVDICKNWKGKDLLGMDDNLIRNNCKLETIDFYFKVIDPGFDLVTKSEMKQRLHAMNEDNSIEDSAFLAMMYSIQALCEQRLANTKRAEAAAQECRKYLTKSDYNMYTKISYAVLSDYFGGEGDDQVAQSYLNHLDRILGEVPPSFKYLLVRAQNSCTIEDRGCSGVMSSIVFIFSLYNPEHNYDLKSIEEGINAQNAGIAISFVQQVNDLMLSIFSKSSFKYTEDYAKMKHTFHEIVFLSGISSIFFALGLEGEIVDALVDRADQIMEAFDVLLSPVAIFPHLAIYMSYRVNRFGYILIEFQHHILNGMDIRSIFCLEKFQKYFNGVVLHLKVMNEFSKRYKRIAKHYVQLYQNLQAIAKWKFDVQTQIVPSALLDDLDTSKDLSSETISEFHSPIISIPESPINISNISAALISNSVKDTELYNSCLEKAKLNQTFSI